MKKTRLLSSALAGLAVLVFCAVSGRAEVNVIPRPLEVEETAGKSLKLTKETVLTSDDPALAALAADSIATRTGLRLPAKNKDGAIGPGLSIRTTNPIPGVSTLGNEGYILETFQSRCGPAFSICSASPAGAFYGLQTFLQLLQKDADGDWSLPIVKITDKPRFAWRGLLLDDARRFFGKGNLKRFLDIMAHYKFNTLQWHLTEDWGWHIEIKKYPKLTSVGAWRNDPKIPGKKPDGKPHGGFYTQDDIREIVAYAAARHITIVPEIEIPAHSNAALAAYPQFGPDDMPKYKPFVGGTWGSRYLFAPKEETFQFLNDVLDEVCELFPSKIIHIGGDEAETKVWTKSPATLEVMRKNKLKNVEELQSWFVRRIEKHLLDKGRRIIGWEEIAQGGLSPTAVMMVWRYDGGKAAKDALANGNNIVMTPFSHCYYDFREGNFPKDPIYKPFGRDTISLKKAYEFEPVPAGITPEQEKRILGCQANVWGENLYTLGKAEYQTFPRALAMSEVAWSAKSGKDWSDFQKRLPASLAWLDRLKVNYRKSDGTPAQPDLPHVYLGE